MAGPTKDNLNEESITTSDDVKAVASFESMNLKEDLLRGIFAYGKLCISMIVRYLNSS